MVKIFVGNIAPGTKEQQITKLFEKYGEVSECVVISNYGFIHMDDPKAANEAIKSINKSELNGSNISVEISHGKRTNEKGKGGGPVRRGRNDIQPRGFSRGPMIRGRPMPRIQMPRGRMPLAHFRPRPWEVERLPVPRGVPMIAQRPLRAPLRGPAPMRPFRPALRGRGTLVPSRPVPRTRGGFIRTVIPASQTYQAETYTMEDPNIYAGQPQTLLYDDGSGFYYDAQVVDSNMVPTADGSAALGEYEYYSAGTPISDPNAVVYDNYGTLEYSTADAYDQSGYYGDYEYEYVQDQTYAVPVHGNGVRYNPYAHQ